MKPGLSVLWLSGLLVTSATPVPGYTTLRDPTRPLLDNPARPSWITQKSVAIPKPALVLPRLELILIGADRRTVVIEGQILQEGEQWQGWRITDIEADAVVLHTPDGPRRLKLALPVLTDRPES